MHENEYCRKVPWVPEFMKFRLVSGLGCWPGSGLKSWHLATSLGASSYVWQIKLFAISQATAPSLQCVFSCTREFYDVLYPFIHIYFLSSSLCAGHKQHSGPASRGFLLLWPCMPKQVFGNASSIGTSAPPHLQHKHLPGLLSSRAEHNGEKGNTEVLLGTSLLPHTPDLHTS